jgi:hypothetical protein
VEVDPLWEEVEENKEGFEASRRKAKGVKDWGFSLRRIVTQQSVWHLLIPLEGWGSCTYSYNLNPFYIFIATQKTPGIGII